MYRAQVDVDPSSVEGIEAAISGLAAMSTVELVGDNLPLPSLYDAAARGLVVYRKELPELQTWLTPSKVLERGWGDCKHFSAWRVAELRKQGRKAMVAVVDRRDAKHPGRFHAVVEHDSGELEDPSLIVIALERQGRAALGAIPVRHNTTIKIREKGRGYLASISAPVHRHRVQLACVGDTKAEALDRAAGLALQLSNDPVLMALMPPQAKVAIVAAKEIARAAREGTLDDFMDSITGPGKKRLAKVLSDEMHDVFSSFTSLLGDGPLPQVQGQYKIIGIHPSKGTCTYQSRTNPKDTFEGPCPQAPAGASSTVMRDRYGNPITTSSGAPMTVATSMPTRTFEQTQAIRAAPTGHPIAHYEGTVDASGQRAGFKFTGGDDGGGTPGHWERLTADEAAQQQAQQAADAAGYTFDPATGRYMDPQTGLYVDPITNVFIDPTTGQPLPPPSQDTGGAGNPLDSSPYGWDSYFDPWMYPGQVPFTPGWGGGGYSPFAPAANTSSYPPPFDGGESLFTQPLDSGAWWTQAGTESMFNGGAWYPEDWPAEQAGMSDVAAVGDVLGDLHEEPLTASQSELHAVLRRTGVDENGQLCDDDDVSDVDDDED